MSAAPDGREAFCKLLETSPVGIACALDFSLDTKGHWFGDHKLDRDTFDRIVALATEEHRRAAVVRVSLRSHKIGGCVPAELGRLTNLKELILAGNDLTGQSRSRMFPSHTGERGTKGDGTGTGNKESPREGMGNGKLRGRAWATGNKGGGHGNGKQRVYSRWKQDT